MFAKLLKLSDHLTNYMTRRKRVSYAYKLLRAGAELIEAYDINIQLDQMRVILFV